jgi:hypothetical protein
MSDFSDQWNVPGNMHYQPETPVDTVLRAVTDYMLRGYWLAYDLDGNLAFVSNQNNADGVLIGADPDDTDVIIYGNETTEFEFDGVGTISIVRYS